jgi:U3 small nucleolar RNA-associated protein 20
LKATLYPDGDFLTAQLKIPLRPLWSPASGALVSLGSSSSKNGDILWQLLWNELVSCTQGPLEDAEAEEEEQPSEQVIVESEVGYGDAGDYESERTWRDPAAHRVRAASRIRLASTLVSHCGSLTLTC